MKKLSVVAFSICALSLLSGCEDYFTFVIKPAEIKVECENEGEMTCNDNSDGTYTIFKCENGKQELKETCNNVSCKKQENGTYTCGECINGEKKYEFKDNVCQKKSCDNGSWSEFKPEPDSLLCGQCEDGDERYYPSEDGSCGFYRCVNNKWEEDIVNSCSGFSCKKVSDDLYQCGECFNNSKEYQFDDSNQCMKRICTNGEWPKTYNEPEVDNLLCGLCKDGETQFAPNADGYCEEQICKNSSWVLNNECGVVSCTKESRNVEGLLIDTYQCGECISGTTEYAIFEQCKKRTCLNGKWSDYSNEPDVSKCGSCNNGEAKYQNETDDEQNLICKKYSCIDGKYQIDNSFITECQNSCTQLLDKCGECINGYFRAQNNPEQICIIETCKNGEWKEEDHSCDASCATTTSEQGVKQEEITEMCGECINNNLYYKDDENGVCQRYSCQSAKLILDDYECSNSCDSSKTDAPEGACGECLNGSVQYTNDNGICIRSICVKGSWAVDNFYNCDSSCLNEGISEDQSDQCGQCVNNREQFYNDDNQICQKKKCENGVYIYDNEFACSNSCTDNECGKCINGDQQCANGTDIETCTNGQYQHTLECPSECKQNGNKAQCQGSCENEGEKKCSNVNNIGISSECKGGKVYDSPCQGNAMCKSETECGECQYGESFCENSQIKTCLNGKWDIATCPDGKSCNNRNKCGECKDGQEKFSDLPNQNCQKYRCIQGRWESQELCKNNVSCSGNGCGNCKNYSFSTNDKELQTCINGKKESNEECLRPPFTSERFITLGEYIVCKYKKILGVSSNENDKINCYSINEGGKHIGYNRSNDTPCNTNSPVSCHVIGVNQTTCGECLELETRCNNKLPQTCINGKWTTDLPEWHTADKCANNE